MSKLMVWSTMTSYTTQMEVRRLLIRWGKTRPTISPFYTVSRGSPRSKATLPHTACQQIKNYTYDTNGFRTSSTDWKGTTTTYTPDSRGLELSRTEASGTAEARTITTEWHATYRVPTKITEPGFETTFTYDSNGNRLTQTRKDLTTLETRTTTWTYSSLGQILTVDGPRTNVTDTTTFTYHNCSTGSECGQVNTITNALGHVTTFTQYNDDGLPSHLTDANGVNTVLTYDSRQRLLSSTVDGLYMTSITYDNAGQITRITAPNGSFIDYEYDDAHRLVATEVALGNRIEYTLDDAGNRTQIDVKDDLGVLRKTQSAVYDELSRMLQSIGASSQTVDYQYDANSNVTSMAISTNPATTSQFDVLDRLIQVTDAESGVTDLEYDALDRLISVTDPNGLETTYTYNAFGNRLSTDNPDTGLTTYTVDKAGNVESKTDARSKTTDYTYDALNRRLTETHADSSLDIIYTYDDTANGNKGKGRLTSITDGSGSTAFTYNSRGLVTSVDSTIGTTNYLVSYGYDDSGQVTSITYPSGRVVDYTYDSANRITQVSTTKDTVTTVLASSISYEPFGPVTALTYGNGLSGSWVYDQDYRITSLSTGTIIDRSYVYDGANNIDSITDGVTPANTQTLDYDYLDRLTDAAGGYGDIDFEYDATGNRTLLTLDGTDVDTYSYTANTHHLSGITGANPQSFAYDLAGNNTTKNAVTQAYDDRGRLSQSTVSSVTTDYIYNALGQRVEKASTSTTTQFVYGMEGQLLAESDGSSAREYIYLNGQPLAAAYTETSPASEEIYYFHNDHLGTLQAMTDDSQTVVWQVDYRPFGETTISVASVENNLRFPGQYFDAESGLHYNYFRDYDPSLGRYIQSDPIGLQGGINTYGYAYQNPVMYTDPNGLNPAAGCLAGAWGGPVGFGVGAGIGTAIAGGIALAAILSTPGDTPTDDSARQAEYQRAKNFCDTPPPPGSNDCSTLSKQIDHAEQCISLYEAWDAKWLPGRHSQKIQTWRNRLQNLKDKHKRECTNKCP